MIFIFIIYLLAQLVFIMAFASLLRKIPEARGVARISVVIAAKNETAYIGNLINSLKRISFSNKNFELIVVDDNSVDGTFETARKISENIENIRVIKAGAKSIPGKRGALLRGIEESKFPFIMITDADCLPSPGWLNAASVLFGQGYDFIFGPAPFIRKQNNFISSVSCMENLKSHFLSFSLASLELPYTAAARNMGFSKEAFFKIGGYDNTRDTISGDDDLLLREAVRNKMKIKAYYDEDALVYSHTADNPGEYLSQRARHTRTSLHYSLKNKLILAGWHLLNLFMLFSPFLVFLDAGFVWPAVVKLSMDILILSLVQKRFRYNFNLFQLLYLDIIYEILLIINFLNSFIKKIEWKGSLSEKQQAF